MKTDKPQNPSEKKPKPYRAFAKYSGLAIQMGLTIYLGNWLGSYLDQKLANSSGLYAKIVTLVAVFLSMYMVITQVIKDSSDQ